MINAVSLFFTTVQLQASDQSAIRLVANFPQEARFGGRVLSSLSGLNCGKFFSGSDEG